MAIDKKNLFSWLVGLGILFPLFFQLSGGIYRETGLMIDSQGVLTKLPLPIAIMTCLIALTFLFGRILKARAAIAMILGTAGVSLLSLWLGSDDATPLQRKLIMSLQVILPLLGLLVGQLIEERGRAVAWAFWMVLCLIVPLQLLATSLQGGGLLAHHLYLFTIYSHYQYVTLILVCAFAYSLISLWDEHKFWLALSAIFMLVYVSRSYSFLTIFAYVSLMLTFIAWKSWAWLRNGKRLALLAMIAGAALAMGILYVKPSDHSIVNAHNFFHGKFSDVLRGEVPGNVQERLSDWKLFGKGIVESNKTLLFGHPQPMPREIRTSPHNWYLDIAYTFGLVGLLPIIALMGYTVHLFWRRRGSISPETWWLAAIVFYLVVIDSNFKVTLRQPYPGIFTYFMWGMLLTRLNAMPIARRGRA